jgi:hypothetical protein
MRCLRIHGFVFCMYTISLMCLYRRSWRWHTKCNIRERNFSWKPLPKLRPDLTATWWSIWNKTHRISWDWEPSSFPVRNRKHMYIMGIETYSSMVFSSMKQILNMTLMFLWWLFFVNSEATIWSVSCMRSSKMIKCFSLGSNLSRSDKPHPLTDGYVPS